MGNYLVFLFIFIISFLSGAEPFVTLKKREPNWKPYIQKTFPDGIPAVILLYEPVKGSEGEIPVKLIENYPNGTMRVETDLKYENGNPVPHGASVTYSPDGTVYMLSTYKDGILDGIIKIFSPDGKLKTRYSVKNGVLEGLKETFHINGGLAEKANYEKGNLEGAVERNFSNGNKEALLHFKNGVLDGTVMTWNEDGSLKDKFTYYSGVLYTDNKPHYDPTITIREPSVEIITSSQPTETPVRVDLEGTQTYHYPNGKLRAQFTYENGALNGRKTLWDEEGVVLEDAFYNHGNLEGRYFIRRPNGQEVIYHYENNRLYGLHQVWHPPHSVFGRVKAFEATFENGLIVGEAAEYNEAGTKISSTFYNKGKKDGIATVYDHEGKVKLTAEFKDDLQEGMAYEYFPNGMVSKQAMFSNDIQNGEEKTFFDNGQLKTHYYQVQGKLHGPAKEYNRRGKLIYFGEYIEGKNNGAFNKYDDKGKLISQHVYDYGVKR